MRSFIHIGDVAAGTRLAVLKGEPGECFHFATPMSLSIRELVECICRRMGASFEDVVDIVGERTGKDHAYRLCTERGRTRLGWTDTVSLETGIDETIAWVDRYFNVLTHEPLDYIHKP